MDDSYADFPYIPTILQVRRPALISVVARDRPPAIFVALSFPGKFVFAGRRNLSSQHSSLLRTGFIPTTAALLGRSGTALAAASLGRR